MMGRRLTTRLAAVTVAAAALGGCAETHRGYASLTRSSPAPVAETDEPDAAGAGVKVVRTAAAPRRVPADPADRMAATPSPREIFDFHPHGVAWRQPVELNPNDGPLAADVRRTAKELKEFLAQKDDGKQSAGLKTRCGETDVAAGKPGCVTAPAKAHAAATVE